MSNNAQSNVVEIHNQSTGIPSTSRPGCWVVPPWPNEAGICAIVRQFLDFNPLVFHSLSEADEKAYYLGYLRALDATSTHDLTCEIDWRWYRDLRKCVARCAAHYTDGKTKTSVARETRAS